MAQIQLRNILDASLANNRIEDLEPLERCLFVTSLSKMELQKNRIRAFPNLGARMDNLRKLALSTV
jgi:Leucine-rich repeat (LRR) protein